MHTILPTRKHPPGHWSTRLMSLALVLAATGVGSRLAISAPTISPVTPPGVAAPANLTIVQSSDQLSVASADEDHERAFHRPRG